MEFWLTISRLFLAAILVIAGIAKAADPDGTRKAFVNFGIPDRIAGQMSWLLPLVEIVIALTLVLRQTSRIGAIAALVLMVVFAVAIGANLIRGRTPDCNCFGQLQSEPISWSVFFRNVVLAALATFIVVGGDRVPGPVDFADSDYFKSSQLVILIALAFVLGLLLTAVMYLRRLLTEQARMLERIEAVERLAEDFTAPPVERADALPPSEGLPVGAPAPSFSLPTLSGETISSDQLLELGKPLMLFFVSPSCGPCAAILQDVKDWQQEYADALTIAILSKGSAEENKKHVQRYVSEHLLLTGDSGVVERYEAKWSPAAVLVGADGRIASPNAFGDDAIRALLANAVAAGGRRSGNGAKLQIKVGTSGLEVGDLLPEFSYADVNGVKVTDRDLSGKNTLLLFWSPTCPFCTAMADDLREFEKHPPAGAPELLFVSTGDPEKVRLESEDYRSRFLHDAQFELGNRLGTNATPSAVLVDSDGRIASSVATGAPSILLLAGAVTTAKSVV